MESEAIKYEDGFSKTNSNLYDDNEEKVEIFDDSFSGSVSLYKLHGGIDQYRYCYIEEANKHLGHDYYKTHDNIKLFAGKSKLKIERGLKWILSIVMS